ncbi:chorismate-binding protein [Pontibacter locisalis]|uniref:isochorismate synthase n=1 Tax=Pontibacter locisalis TaxID=1719035 RepID=A0ABW5IPW8_9BACT
MGAEPQEFSLERIFQAAIAQNRAVAFWRLPHTKEVNICVSLQENLLIHQPKLEESPFGFLFSPFQESGGYRNNFIKADIHYSTETGALTFSPDVPAAALEDFKEALASSSTLNVGWHTPSTVIEQKHQTEEGFVAAVEKAKEAIGNGEMEKVVLSRNIQRALPVSFSPFGAFATVQQEYPRAFVSLVSVPEVGTWMGASPEILVSINPEQIFHTVALAGTQPAAENPAEAIWRQKEIEEQGMVERYILSCFKSLRLREYTEVGPRTVIAGNLMHLRTDFKVDLKEVNFPTLGSAMLALLHPTSAVCGLPKEPALEFILAHEGYNRAYYSGYLGPVGSPGGTHLFVNLRCMELLKNDVILFAGAGITGDSNPQKEWQETQHKMQTMQKILSTFE